MYKDIEKRKEYQRNYYKKQRELFPEKVKEQTRKNGLKYRFGIDLEDYNIKFNLQNGCCAICGRHQSELKLALAVDHNHITNKIRGLLCTDCNIALGLLQTDTNYNNLQKAINYLKVFEK